jgi:hypothetical protein
MSRTGDPNIDLMLYAKGIPRWLDLVAKLNRFFRFLVYLFCAYVLATSGVWTAIKYAAAFTIGDMAIAFMGMQFVRRSEDKYVYIASVLVSTVFIIGFNLAAITYHLNRWSFESGIHRSTAEALSVLINREFSYPKCTDEGCILGIEYEGNSVIASYSFPLNFNELPSHLASGSEQAAEVIRSGALKKLCAERQPNFPDPSMEWINRYYSKDSKLVTTITFLMSECD